MSVTDIVEYFMTDPMRILYVLGGTGGVWYWVCQWRDRIRIQLRIIKGGSFISEDLDRDTYIKCEVENIGGRQTSLQPVVTLKAYTQKRAFRRYEGRIVENERDLPPHKPKIFTVDFHAGNIYDFLLFLTYTFHPTRGLSKSVRVRSATLERVGFWRFRYELTCFRWFGRFSDQTSGHTE
jgi:hypothetical protein